MKKSIEFFKIVSASLALFIFASHGVCATEVNEDPTLNPTTSLRGGRSSLATRIRIEVDRILTQFKQNMEAYYQRTRAKKKPATATAVSSLIEKEEQEKQEEDVPTPPPSIETPQRAIYTDDASYISENSADMKDSFDTENRSNFIYKAIQEAYNSSSKKPGDFLRLMLQKIGKTDIYCVIRRKTQWIETPLSNDQMRRETYKLDEDEANKNNIVKCIKMLTERYKQYGFVLEEEAVVSPIVKERQDGSRYKETIQLSSLKMQINKDDPRSVFDDFYFIMMDNRFKGGGIEDILQALGDLSSQKAQKKARKAQQSQKEKQRAIERFKRQQREEHHKGLMKQPEWLLNTSNTNLKARPVNRGHILFNWIKVAYNALSNDMRNSPLMFLKNLNMEIGKIKSSPLDQISMYCIMKDSNSGSPWKIIELINAQFEAAYTAHQKDFSACMDYITKDYLSYELIPDDEHTEADQSFFAFKMKTGEGEHDIQDNFYLIESSKDESLIKRFVETLNQPTEQK